MSRWSHLADDDDGQAGKEGVEEPKPRLLRRSSVPAPSGGTSEKAEHTGRDRSERERETNPAFFRANALVCSDFSSDTQRALAHLGAPVQSGGAGAGAIPASAISDLTTGTQDPERKTVRAPRGEERSKGRGGGGKC